MTCDLMLEWLEKVLLDGRDVAMYYTQSGITISGDVYGTGETLATAIQSAMMRDNVGRTILNKLKSGDEPKL